MQFGLAQPKAAQTYSLNVLRSLSEVWLYKIIIKVTSALVLYYVYVACVHNTTSDDSELCVHVSTTAYGQRKHFCLLQVSFSYSILRYRRI